MPRRFRSSTSSRRTSRNFKACCRDDVKVSYEFDQSPYVTRAISGLTLEGALGAVLTGLMVLLFLRDWRSAFIVVINIPLSLMAAVLALWITQQTINIMTLGGLALAVGILVDEATVCHRKHSHASRRAANRSARAVARRRPPKTRVRGCSRCSASSRCSCRVLHGRRGARRCSFRCRSRSGFSMVASYLLVEHARADPVRLGSARP